MRSKKFVYHGWLHIYSMQNMLVKTGQYAQVKEPVMHHLQCHTCVVMLRRVDVDVETRAKMLSHSSKTASKCGQPGESEIDKTASLLDHAEAAKVCEFIKFGCLTFTFPKCNLFLLDSICCLAYHPPAISRLGTFRTA